MARRATRFVRPRKSTKVWLGAGIAATSLSASTAILFSSLTSGALALRPFTILRTRLILSVTSDQLSASEFAQGAYTHQVVTDSAVAAGIASIPTPLSETEADYYVYQPWISNFLLATGVGFAESVG